MNSEPRGWLKRVPMTRNKTTLALRHKPILWLVCKLPLPLPSSVHFQAKV
ncbi:MAG: hypothetical protein N2116_05015 [Armatimonadetes bacterium]|nr:hypothetical protein [Armatimonadota bacterium]